MNLTGLFSGFSHINGTDTQVSEEKVTAQTAADLNKLIQALIPGQTLQGEILSRNGTEVQIRLYQNLILNARLDQNIQLEEGRNLTFEVKNNGSSLTLRPLFTNVATDQNVIKALDMAALPVNHRSVMMTEQLMKASLPVNKASLQQIYREINLFPENEVSDIIDLHRLGLPVNRENVEQMANYRNMNYWIEGNMEAVADALSESVTDLVSTGDMEVAKELLGALFADETEAFGQEIMKVLSEQLSGQPGLEEASRALLQGEVFPANETLQSVAEFDRDTELPKGEELPKDKELPNTSGLPEDKELSNPGKLLNGSEPLKETGLWEATEGYRNTEGTALPSNTKLAHNDIDLPTGHQPIPDDFLKNTLDDIAKEPIDSKALWKELLIGKLKKEWMIRPEDVSDPEKVGEFYKKMKSQLRDLSDVLYREGQTESALWKTTTSMAQKVDFMEQINQIYSYVQLPLKMANSEAHGDLYVYTNKRNRSTFNDTVTALLHLDMKHLGPLDVYVTLKDSNVDTNFRLADEETLLFLEKHMDLLTGRLEKRGYHCSFGFRTKDSESSASGLAPLMKEETDMMVSKYSFDVRT